MERKIGEVFEYNGEWYQCVKDDFPFNCQKCCFYNGADKECSAELIGYCSSEFRSDEKEIIFKKLEKVGEPFRFSGSLIFQKYVLPISNPAYKGDRSLFFSAPSDTFMYVKLEQNQENMEEKKLNLKEFDLEKAKAGKPVYTRDGRKVRIICFDKKNDSHTIVSLVETETGDKEELFLHTDEGKYIVGRECDERDLMMLPEKHEGWTNVYKDGQNRFTRGFFQTKETAENATNPPGATRIATVKIEWEE